jgi:hypothetical protein
VRSPCRFLGLQASRGARQGPNHRQPEGGRSGGQLRARLGPGLTVPRSC